MNLVVNHRGERKLVVTKPDAKLIAKALPLLDLAAVFYNLESAKAIVDDLCGKIINANAEDEEPAQVQQDLPFETEA